MATTRPLQIVLPRTKSVERVVVKEVQTVNVPVPAAEPQADRDTQGNIVPVWKPHAYTYDASNNLQTDTVSDGINTWVRTFTYSNGNQTGDSGWVKQ